MEVSEEITFLAIYTHIQARYSNIYFECKKSPANNGSRGYLDDNAAKYVKTVMAKEQTDHWSITKEQCYMTVLKCLQNCLRTHTMCPRSDPTTTLLPDRVIDCSNPRKPRIVETGGTQYGSYVALSYIWGDKQPLTTTKNIDKYVNEGLDISQFPATIRDAVTVMHGLGQRYLWIDALCILQDSPQDLITQLKKMCQIYRNNLFTISAACAETVQEGFLPIYSSRSIQIPNAHIPYRCPDGTLGTIYICHEKAKYYSGFGPNSGIQDTLDPINRRAWCLQERFLPPRNVIYANSISFSCQTTSARINSPLSCNPRTDAGVINALLRPRNTPSECEKIMSTEQKESERSAFRELWLDVLRNYTARRASYASDKFPALAALVEQFHLATGDQYLAGLWKKTLLFDLLWKRAHRFAPRPQRYRAPSWSWAAREEGVSPIHQVDEDKWSADPEILKVEILECEVELKNKDLPFGEVTGGFLKLKGRLKRAVVRYGSEYDYTWYTGDAFSKGPNGEMVQIGMFDFDAKEHIPEEIYIIPFIWDAQKSFIYGIVVIKANKDQYRRVAHFDQFGYSDHKWIDDLEEQEIVII